MHCPVCGKENVENRPFCGGCGHNFSLTPPAPIEPAPVEPVAAPVAPAPAPAPAPVYAPIPQPVYAAPQPTIPEEYKPLGAWMYFLWNIVFSIPLVGLVMLIVFSCGGTQNINLRNYARSFFCALAVGLVVVILLAILFASLGLSFASYAGFM